MGLFADRIDPREMEAGELVRTLDELVSASSVGNAAPPLERAFNVLNRVQKVNPHQHITGSVGRRDLLKRVIYVYRQDSAAGSAFQEYIRKHLDVPEQTSKKLFDRPEEVLVRWLERNIPLHKDPLHFKEADDRLNLVRLAFQSPYSQSVELLKDAYRTAALENLSHGVSEIWFRTSLGDHEDESFSSAVRSALEGARQAELESHIPFKVRFVVGMRKHGLDEETASRQGFIDTRAGSLVANLVQLSRANAEIKDKMIGVDSVGLDSGWRPELQAPARSLAAACGFHIAVHFGESWHPGGLISTLERLKGLLSNGDVKQLDNSNALFAAKDIRNPQQGYSDSDWHYIRGLQSEIFGLLIKNKTSLGINPTSNDWLTRTLRHQEGWRFRYNDEPINEGMESVSDLVTKDRNDGSHLRVVVGNDNSRIYPSRLPSSYLTVSEELAILWNVSGRENPCIYGKLPTSVIANLILNGFRLTESVGSKNSKSAAHPAYAMNGNMRHRNAQTGLVLNQQGSL